MNYHEQKTEKEKMLRDDMKALTERAEFLRGTKHRASSSAAHKVAEELKAEGRSHATNQEKYQLEHDFTHGHISKEEYASKSRDPYYNHQQKNK